MNKKGQALIVTYIIIGCLLVISSALLYKAVTERNLLLRNQQMTEVFYLAEGAIENSISVFTSAIANYQVAPDVENMDLTTTYTTFYNTAVNSTITRLENTERNLTEGDTNIRVRNYEITATAIHPLNNNIRITLHQIIARRLIPTFQHAVFYNGDLEILPGKAMTLTGRIHANQSIYIDADSNANLKIDSFYLRSAGDIYNHRKDDGSNLTGTVSIRVTKNGSAKYENMDSGTTTIMDSDVPGWTDGALDLWGGTVQSSAQGITKLAAPAVGSIQPGGYYSNNASVVITNKTIVKNGTTLKEGKDYPTGTITETTSFYNNRDGKTVRMSVVDLSKLSGIVPAGEPRCNTCTNNLPSNGLLYVTRNNAGQTEEPGIKLINGETLNTPSGINGLTVVSNDPVYVKGNYNSSSSKSAAVICDAINLLSGDWVDSTSTSGLGARKAEDTTINAAFIAGIDTTQAGKYNGGLENYPRLHEDWGNANLNITGSFVALWESAISKGKWKYGEPQYAAPKNRNWTYNTNFNNVANLPPFTPWAVEARRIAWWAD